jgi:hypothetical protein
MTVGQMCNKETRYNGDNYTAINMRCYSTGTAGESNFKQESNSAPYPAC